MLCSPPPATTLASSCAGSQGFCAPCCRRSSQRSRIHNRPKTGRTLLLHERLQTCIVHLLRHSLDFVSWKDRKSVAAALKDIYRAVDAVAAETALTAFEEGSWGGKYPAIGQSWRRAWGEVVPFYAFPVDVRRILYTTNAIEALNSKLRRAVRARAHLPSDEPAMKLLFLVLNRAEKEWIMPPREWCRPRRSSPFSSASALHVRAWT